MSRVAPIIVPACIAGQPPASLFIPSRSPAGNQATQSPARRTRTGAYAPYYGGTTAIHRANGRGRRSADVRGVQPAAALAQQDHPRALEWRGRLDSPRRVPAWRGLRESHQLSGPRPDPLLPRRVQRDRDPVPLWQLPLRQQGWATGGQPLPDGRRRPRTPARTRAHGPLGRGARYLV